MDIKEQLTKAIHASTLDAFGTMLSMDLDISSEKFELKEEESLICSIGVAGNINGNVSVCLTEKSAAKIVSTMLGMEIEPGSDDVLDGIGEVANLIAGGTKNNLAGLDECLFNISIPSTVKGTHLEIGDQKETTLVEMDFSCEEIALKIAFVYKVDSSGGKGGSAGKDTADAKNDALAILNALGGAPQDSVAESCESEADPVSMSDVELILAEAVKSAKDNIQETPDGEEAVKKLDEAMSKFKKIMDE